MLYPERANRPDRTAAHVVTVGLILAEEDSRPAAAAFMNQAGVPFRAIVRVLSDSAELRRHPRP